MDEQPPIEHVRHSRIQRLGAILWPAFFTAFVMTLVFALFVDPLELRDITYPELPFEIGRGWGYTLAFFVFWAATTSSSLFTWYLLRPGSRFNVPLKD